MSMENGMSIPPMRTQEQPIRTENAMLASRLTALPPAPELDGQEEMGPPLVWVALDNERGLMISQSLDVSAPLEMPASVGIILQSRVVRVMADRDGQVLCASSNRKAADVGRPGRECALCEDRSAVCFPRWWISWRELASGKVFAHTLGRTGSLNFTRYVARLRRVGLSPSQVTTRLFVEETRRQQNGPILRCVQFTQVKDSDDPFID